MKPKNYNLSKKEIYTLNLSLINAGIEPVLGTTVEPIKRYSLPSFVMFHEEHPQCGFDKDIYYPVEVGQIIDGYYVLKVANKDRILIKVNIKLNSTKVDLIF